MVQGNVKTKQTSEERDFLLLLSNKNKMQGQQTVLRQTDQSPVSQQTGNIVIKMNETIQPITTVGKCPSNTSHIARNRILCIFIAYMSAQRKFICFILFKMKSHSPRKKNRFLFCTLCVAILNSERLQPQ